MDHENKNDLPMDWLDQPQADDAPLTEADLEAQKWLEDLLASSSPEEPAQAEPAPQESAVQSLQDVVPETKDDHWFQQLEMPADSAQEIHSDETALSSHEMTDMADMELEKIIQEAMSQDWDVAAIENEILSEPIAEAFPDTGMIEPESAPAAMLYTDDGEDPDEEPEEQRKVRPKRKKGYGLFGLPHIVSTVIWAVICVSIGVSLGRLIWICAADILAFGRQDKDVVITIEAQDDLDSITEKLHEAGLIKYPSLFKFYADLAGVEEKGKISAGTFTLNTMYDYHALVGGMSSTSSYRQTVKVTIPEGYTCAQMFALLEESGVCTAAELEEYCTQSEFSSYWFLEDVEKGTKYCLEGFLFPDTYQFYTNSTAQQVLIKLLGGFDNHFTDEMVAQLDVLNQRLAAMYKKNGLSQSYIDQHQLTVKDIVTVASMIEKESAFSGESRSISSVIYNRLTNPSNYPKLNIDATVVYALGGKADLTSEDMKIDSPYNTYLYDGLPPGAISNPGQYSLAAALDPEDTKYYFYALDPTAEITSHRFFKTHKEHQAFLDSLE